MFGTASPLLRLIRVGHIICSTKLYLNTYLTPTLVQGIKYQQHNLQVHRFKSKKSKDKTKSQITESETEKEEVSAGDEIIDKISKTMNINVPSLRVDAILKSGLGVSRNKIENLFYESKIRLNGEKILKKSAQVQTGDELDVIRGVSSNNPDMIVVARVEVVGISVKDENINVKVRRFKNLLVDNYDDKWKASE